jgi:hypothetical protein
MRSFRNYVETYITEASESDFSHIPDFDPTNPEHKALVKAFNIGHSKNDPKIPRQKNQIKKNIPSLEDLKAKVAPHMEAIAAKKKAEIEKKEAVQSGANVIKENPDTGLKAYHVKTRDAAVALGQKGWCVAEKDPMRNMFHHYDRGRSVMIHMPNESEPYRKVAFFPGKQVGVSQRNQTINDSDFKKLLERNPEIKDIPHIWGSREELPMPEHLKPEYAKRLTEKLKKGTHTAADITHAQDNRYLNEQHKELLPSALTKKLEDGTYTHHELVHARENRYLNDDHKNLLPSAFSKKIAKGDYTSDDVKDAVNNGYLTDHHKKTLSDDFENKLKEGRHNFDDILSAEHGRYLTPEHKALLAKSLLSRLKEGKHDIAEVHHAQRSGYFNNMHEKEMPHAFLKKLKANNYINHDIEHASQNGYMNDEHKEILASRLLNKIKRGAHTRDDISLAKDNNFYTDEHAKELNKKEVEELTNKIKNNTETSEDIDKAHYLQYLTQEHKDLLSNKLSEKIKNSKTPLVPAGNKSDRNTLSEYDIDRASKAGYLTDEHRKLLADHLTNQLEKHNGMDHFEDPDVTTDSKDINAYEVAKRYGYDNDWHKALMGKKLLHDLKNENYGSTDIRDAKRFGYLDEAHVHHIRQNAINDSHDWGNEHLTGDFRDHGSTRRLSKHLNSLKLIGNTPETQEALKTALVNRLKNRENIKDTTKNSFGDAAREYDLIAPYLGNMGRDHPVQKSMSNLLNAHLDKYGTQSDSGEIHPMDHASDNYYLNNTHKEKGLFELVKNRQHDRHDLDKAEKEGYLSKRIKDELPKALDSTADNEEQRREYGRLVKHAAEHGYLSNKTLERYVQWNPDDWEGVTHNLNSLQLHNLSKSDSREVRHLVAKHKNVSPVTLHSMANRESHNDSKWVSAAIASNPNTRADTLHKLISDNHTNDGNLSIRVVDHPNVSDETLRQVTNTANNNEFAAKEAKEKLKLREKARGEEDNFVKGMPTIKTEHLHTMLSMKKDVPLFKKHQDKIKAELLKRGESVPEDEPEKNDLYKSKELSYSQKSRVTRKLLKKNKKLKQQRDDEEFE